MDHSNHFPPGFKFVPMDEELLFYLQCKVNGIKIRDEENVPLKYVELYNIENPKKLFQDTNEETVYVFTKLKKVSENGKRYGRQIRETSYTWKGSDSSRHVSSSVKSRPSMGTYKNFSFQKGKEKLGYNMKELTLNEWLVNNNPEFEDYVVCIIKRKTMKKDFQEETENNLHDQRPIPNGYNYYANYFPSPTFTPKDNMDLTNIASSSSAPPFASLPASHAHMQEFQQFYRPNITPLATNYSSNCTQVYDDSQNSCQVVVNQFTDIDASFVDQINGYDQDQNNNMNRVVASTIPPPQPATCSRGNAYGPKTEGPKIDEGGNGMAMIDDDWQLEDISAAEFRLV